MNLKRRNLKLIEEANGLTQRLEAAASPQKKIVVIRQATEDAVAARIAAEQQVVVLSTQLVEAKRSGVHASKLSDAMVSELQEQDRLRSKGAEDVVYKLDGLRARVQQLQGGLKWLNSAVARV